MTQVPTDWIAPTGIRPVDPEATHTDVPVGRMHAAGLSLTARGLYAELLSYQSAPIDPFARAIDPPEEVRAAVDELIAHGFVVGVPQPLKPED
jgi:hypothetical protein